MKTLLLLLVSVMAHADITTGWLQTRIFDGKAPLMVGAQEGDAPRNSPIQPMIFITLFSPGTSSYAYPASCDSDKRAIAHLGGLICAKMGQEVRKKLVYDGSYGCAVSQAPRYLLSVGQTTLAGTALKGELLPRGTTQKGVVYSVNCREGR